MLETQTRYKTLGVKVLSADEARDPWYFKHSERQLKRRIEETARHPMALGPCCNVHVDVGLCVSREHSDRQELAVVVQQAYCGDISRHTVNSNDLLGPGNSFVGPFKA